jgi:type II secretory ATPase GspE/PulE/Tfp pilus assembly ATPase PilB-like protein
MPAAAAPDARQLVDALLDLATRRVASDLHLEPTATGYEARLRVDGVLETVAHHPPDVGRSLVTRLMVMAQLLTYRLDVPQEGRLRVVVPAAPEPLEVRLAVIPTTHGLRAAVRMPAELSMPRRLGDLGLPPRVMDGLNAFARTDAGMLIVTGPAGSGKTTTLYALLQHIVETTPGVSVVSLEDPVERDLPGVTQIEVTPFGEMTYEKALRSILRQDPQVLMLGEIRDSAVASLALQAALSGHRLLCTLHAATPALAITRLVDMGLEPYQVTSALHGVVAQRLLRRRASAKTAGQTSSGSVGQTFLSAREEPSANKPLSTSNYQGRTPIAEFATLDADLRRAILARADADTVSSLLQSRPGYQTLRQSAEQLTGQGITDENEVRRVLGDSPRV